MANGSDPLYRLSENLLDQFEKLWTFAKTEGMEPTNNLAERDLRKLVIWRKKAMEHVVNVAKASSNELPR